MNTPYSLPTDRTPRATPWVNVSDEQWNDWRWQMANRINSYEEFAQFIDLTESETAGLKAPNKFHVDITPYFASLIDPQDPDCPVRLQVIPRAEELQAFEAQMEDSLGEDAHSPVPGLVHRYPDRVLMLVTTQCASYCRYCTRSRVVGDPTAAFFNRANYQKQLEYLRRTPQVRDVLLSGGDPLTLNPKILDELLTGLRSIPHIEIIRIGSRVPVFLPQRVTDEFVDMLRKHHPLWMNIHVNHPKEITPELVRACAKLADAGIPLGNQSVLLAGVNDHPNTMRKLVHDLVKMRVRPYYLYMADLVEGSGHFRTTLAAGLEIMESLRGHTSGYAVPTFAVDIPGGGGKVPVAPNYLLSQSHHRIVFRNFEGYLSTYTEPTNYKPPRMTRWIPEFPAEPGQRGVAGLLAGESMAIKPAGWDSTHLNRDDQPAPAPIDLADVANVEVAPEGNQPGWVKLH